MEFAVQHVPDQKDMTYIGMINKGACRQLLIKCYLANGEFQKAKEQADILISQSGYKLMTETFGTFSNPHPTTWNITHNVMQLIKKQFLLCLIVMVQIPVSGHVQCVIWYLGGMQRLFLRLTTSWQ